jgi:transcriptional regulator with XRE-family HTH domain
MTQKKILPEDQAVGRQIRSHRIARGMSQTDLANHIGVTFQQVQKYEKGVNRVSAGRLQVISNLFKVHVADLMGAPKRGNGGDENNPLLVLGQTREGHRVAKAFNDISDHHEVRLAFASLMERVADVVRAK